MTKADLKIILLKIQNRCGLEEPTKITYYWNDKQQVVFKAFFESLYLPEALRVDEDNIQNSFTVQNVYEFEDEFEIIGLNQDEGYVEFIPDNQKFKVVSSYKDANKKENSKEESLIHLVQGNKINETFARSKGYILQESEEDLKNGLDGANTKDAEEAGKDPKEKKTDVVAYTVAINNPLSSKEGASKIWDTVKSIAASKLKSSGSDLPAKVFVGITPIESREFLGFTALAVQALSYQIGEALGKPTTAVYSLVSGGNKEANQVLTQSKIAASYSINNDITAAKNLINYANAPQLGNLKKLPDGMEGVDDTTDLKSAIDVCTPMLDNLGEVIAKYGAVRPEPARDSLENEKGNTAKGNSEDRSGNVDKKSKPKDKPEEGEANEENSNEGETKSKKGSKANIATDVKNAVSNAKGAGTKTNAKITKTWDLLRRRLSDMINADKRLGIAIVLLKDLYTKNDANKAKDVFKNREETYRKVLKDANALGDISGFGNRMKVAVNAAAKQFGDTMNQYANQERNVDNNTYGGTGFTKLKQHGANASTKAGSSKETKKTPNVIDYGNDFGVWLTFFGDRGPGTYKPSGEFFSSITSDSVSICGPMQTLMNFFKAPDGLNIPMQDCIGSDEKAPEEGSEEEEEKTDESSEAETEDADTTEEASSDSEGAADSGEAEE